MVADALTYHPTVTHYLSFLATTIGRDKLLRLLQYYSRFYAWYLFRTNGTPGEIQPYAAMKTQFGLARKIMRIGKNVEHFKAASVAYDSKALADPLLKYLTVGRQLGYAVYLTADMFTVPDSLGMWKSETAKRVQKEAYKAWWAGISCSAISGMYSLYRLRQRELSLSKENGEGVVEAKRLEKERSAVMLQLTSDLCDLTVPSAALGWVNFDDGIVGLAGTVSSLIGVYNVWKKTA